MVGNPSPQVITLPTGIKHFGDDDDDELFLWYGWPTKGVYAYFQSRPLSDILTIANLRSAASRVWSCVES